MTKELIRDFYEVASEAMDSIAKHLKPGMKLALIAYRPGIPEREMVLTDGDLKDVVEVIQRRINHPAVFGPNAGTH